MEVINKSKENYYTEMCNFYWAEWGELEQKESDLYVKCKGLWDLWSKSSSERRANFQDKKENIVKNFISEMVALINQFDHSESETELTQSLLGDWCSVDRILTERDLRDLECRVIVVGNYIKADDKKNKFANKAMPLLRRYFEELNLLKSEEQKKLGRVKKICKKGSHLFRNAILDIFGIKEKNPIEPVAMPPSVPNETAEVGEEKEIGDVQVKHQAAVEKDVRNDPHFKKTRIDLTQGSPDFDPLKKSPVEETQISIKTQPQGNIQGSYVEKKDLQSRYREPQTKQLEEKSLKENLKGQNQTKDMGRKPNPILNSPANPISNSPNVNALKKKFSQIGLEKEELSCDQSGTVEREKDAALPTTPRRKDRKERLLRLQMKGLKDINSVQMSLEEKIAQVEQNSVRTLLQPPATPVLESFEMPPEPSADHDLKKPPSTRDLLESVLGVIKPNDSDSDQDSNNDNDFLDSNSGYEKGDL